MKFFTEYICIMRRFKCSNILIYSHKKWKDSLETRAIYIEHLFGILKYKRPKTMEINFKKHDKP